jgi:hypothetical protein
MILTLQCPVCGTSTVEVEAGDDAQCECGAKVETRLEIDWRAPTDDERTAA